MRVPYGEQAGKAKITEKQAKAIMRDPRPYAETGADYNVAASTIGSINNVSPGATSMLRSSMVRKSGLASRTMPAKVHCILVLIYHVNQSQS
jgi:hypothetical protein